MSWFWSLCCGYLENVWFRREGYHIQNLSPNGSRKNVFVLVLQFFYNYSEIISEIFFKLTLFLAFKKENIHFIVCVNLSLMFSGSLGKLPNYLKIVLLFQFLYFLLFSLFKFYWLISPGLCPTVIDTLDAPDSFLILLEIPLVLPH